MAAAPTAPPQRLLVECTYTRLHGGRTGCQRVVRNLVRELPPAGRAAGVEVIPVAWTPWGFCRVESVPSDAPAALRRAEYLESVWHNGRSLARAILAPMLRARRRAIASVDDAACGVAPPRRSRFARMRDHALFRSAFPRRARRAAAVEPRRGDTLLLLDSSWHIDGLFDAVESLRRDVGMRVGLVVYDLIPLRTPQFCDPHLVRVFHAWWRRARGIADVVLGISDAMRRDAEAAFAEGDAIPLGGRPAFASFRLGCELDLAGAEDPVRGALLRALEPPAGAAAFLTVGTIEPRKNHGLILDAMERLWSAGSDARLIVAGKVGWLCDYTMNRLRTHPQAGQRLFVFHDLSDAELETAYRRSNAVVCASVAEGYGLPLAEALARGTPAAASDIPSHREIGEGHCAFFAPHDAAGLARLLSGRLPRPGRIDWPTWRDSAEDVLRGLRAAATLGQAGSSRAG